MSALQLEAVGKHYGAAKAVDRISFATPSGKLVVLLGPSGCGKSTTLRIIAGLDTPSAGPDPDRRARCHVAGAGAARISMVFQNYALFPHLSVRENILFGVKVRREPAADHGRRLARVADLLGLSGLLERKPSQLSGGQQQRVALGRAIIAETKVCLMDEPLSNLDAQLRQEMRREMRDAAAEARHHHGLRHPRPDRGDEHGRPGGAAQRRPDRAGRAAARALCPAGLGLRRALHRHAADEPRSPLPGRHRAASSACARSSVRLVESGGVAGVVQSAEYLGADTWSCTCGRRHTRRDPRGARRRAATSWPKARACASAGARTTATVRRRAGLRRSDVACIRSRSRLNRFPEETPHEKSPVPDRPRRRGRLPWRCRAAAQKVTEVNVLLPGRRRRPDHQDDRPDGGRLREGEPGHQGQPDLRRHLPGDASSRRSPRTRAASRRSSRCCCPPTCSR